jgi:hypothetical protein
MSIIREDNIKQPEYDPFDAPIPGQSLTDTPGNYPWEHPPKTVDPEEALDKFWNRLTDPEVAEEIILMMEAGVPVEALARILTFTGFAEGEFTPDVGFLTIEPLMKMIAAIGMRAGVKNLNISLEDFSNKETIKNMLSLKEVNERIEEVVDEKKQAEPKGLMAPKKSEEE